MKHTVTICALILCAATGSAMAGSGYDACLQEEKELKSKETASCGGLSYLLNPSPCYATRRALKEYKAGKCREIGVAEGVDFTARPAVPERIAPPVPVSEPKRPARPETPRVEPVRETPQVQPQKNIVTLEGLQAENARLRAEITRLKNENEQLRKGRPPE